MKINSIGEVPFILDKPLFFLIDTGSTSIMVKEVKYDVFDNDKCVFELYYLKGCKAHNPEEMNESDSL